MSRRDSPGEIQALTARFSAAKEISTEAAPNVEVNDRHRFFGVFWYVVNTLLILAIFDTQVSERIF
jgi:hypothetical protein